MLQNRTLFADRDHPSLAAIQLPKLRVASSSFVVRSPETANHTGFRASGPAAASPAGTSPSALLMTLTFRATSAARSTLPALVPIPGNGFWRSTWSGGRTADGVSACRLPVTAARDADKAGLAHQPCDGTARDRDALASEHDPDLARAVTPAAVMLGLHPDDLGQQRLVAQRASRSRP